MDGTSKKRRTPLSKAAWGGATAILITLCLASHVVAQIQPVGSPWRRLSAGISYTNGKHVAIGPEAVVDDGTFWQQDAAHEGHHKYVQQIAETMDSDSKWENAGQSIYIEADPERELYPAGGDPLANLGQFYAQHIGVFTPLANARAIYVLAGSRTEGYHQGSGYVDHLNGTMSYATVDGAGDVGDRMTAVSGFATSTGTGDVNVLAGIYANALHDGSGTVTNLSGVHAFFGGASTGPTTNLQGLLIDDVSGETATNKWAIRSLGGNSYHAGSFRVGGSQAQPTARLEVDASGANQTPLTIKTNGVVDNYTPSNSGIWIYDAAGDEIMRIFAGDPDPDYIAYNTHNLYIGYKAGEANLVDAASEAGYGNTGVGYEALLNNLTGHNNSAYGEQALEANESGATNSAFGFNSLVGNISGDDNSAFGRSSLANSLGDRNSALGSTAGDSVTTDTDMVFVGYDADRTGGPFTNSIGIGSGVRVTASNQAVLGNDSIVSTLLKGTVTLQASTTTRSSFRVTPGVAPTAPVNGDIWVTTAGVFARVNGATEDLTDGGGAGGDDVSIDGVGVTNPDFVSTGDIDFVDTSNTITANINAGSIVSTDFNAAAIVTEAEGLASSDNDTSVPTTAAVIDAIAAGGGGGAPTDATYLTQTADGTLSAEQALSSLSSGIMRVATTTGVVTSLTDSAGIAANISDETGTGALVFAASPTLTGNVTVDQSTGTANGLTVDADAFTSGVAINASNANALTTGSIARFHSDSPSTGTRNLVSIINDNTAASGAVSLYVQQDGAGLAANVVGDAKLGNVARIQIGDVDLAGTKYAGIWIGSPSSDVTAPTTNNYAFLKGNGTTLINAPSGEAIHFRINNVSRAILDSDGHIIPGADSTYNLGADAARWANVYADNINTATALFSGNVDMSGLPTSDPSIAGRLWNDAGTLKVSAGP